jgi:lipopolysaccharide export system permease protein
MRILDRYIQQAVISSILIVLMVVVGLDGISRIIEESDDIVNDYTFIEVLIYVGLTMPGRIYGYLPFVSMVGCLVGLGTLANNSELVVMRAAGVSILRLIWTVMKPAMIFMLAGILIGEYVAPTTEKIAQSRQSVLMYGNEIKISGSGLWNREGNEYMHFNAAEPGGVLYGVTLYRFNDTRQLDSALFANRATYRGKGNGWLLENVSETVFTGLETHLNKYVTQQWSTQLSPDLLNFVVLEADDLSVRGLWVYARYLGEHGLNNGEYWLAFWRKVLHPLATASLVLIGISFVFGPLREVSMGQRIFSGVMIGIIFKTSQDLLGPASLVFGFEPLYAVLIPIFLCAAIGVYLLSRVR